jgi:hypothetical protein
VKGGGKRCVAVEVGAVWHAVTACAVKSIRCCGRSALALGVGMGRTTATTARLSTYKMGHLSLCTVDLRDICTVYTRNVSKISVNEGRSYHFGSRYWRAEFRSTAKIRHRASINIFYSEMLPLVFFVFLDGWYIDA